MDTSSWHQKPPLAKFSAFMMKTVSFNDDAYEFATDAFAELRLGLNKCLQNADIFIEIRPWLVQMQAYIHQYGCMFSIEDCVSLVKLFYAIFSSKSVDYEVLLQSITIAKIVLRMKNLQHIPAGTLSLQWRPLFENLRHINKKANDALDTFPIVPLMDLTWCSSQLALFFPAEEMPHIWEEVRPGLHVNFATSDIWFSLLKAIMPMRPCDHRFALSTWIPHVFAQLHLPVSLWDLNSVVEATADMVRCYAARIDMTPHLPLLMDILMRSLPVGNQDDNPERCPDLSSEFGRMVADIFIQALLPSHTGSFHTDSGLPLDPLACILTVIRRTRPFLHSQLQCESAKEAVMDILITITENLYNRVKAAHKPPLPAEYLGDISMSEVCISEVQVDRIIQELQSSYQVCLYHSRSGQLLTLLARLRPSWLVPMVLQEFYAALETLHETPDRLLQSLRHLKSVSPFWAVACSDPMACGHMLQPTHMTHSWCVEGKRALFPLMENILPLISIENMKLSSLALPLCFELGAWFPMANCVDDKSIDHTQLTEAERELLQLTAKFDDYIVDLFKRLQHMFTDVSHSATEISVAERMLQQCLFTNMGKTMMFFRRLRSETRLQLGRAMLDFYLSEMLSINWHQGVLQVVNFMLPQSAAVHIVEQYFPLVLDKLEALLQDHNHRLHYNGEADATFAALIRLLRFLCLIAWPQHRGDELSRLIVILHRLYEETEICVAKLAAGLLSELLSTVSLSQLEFVSEDGPSSAGTLFTSIALNSWTIFVPLNLVQRCFSFTDSAAKNVQEEDEIAQRLWNEFVVKDVERLENMLSQVEDHKLSTVNDVEFRVVVARIHSVIKLFLSLSPDPPTRSSCAAGEEEENDPIVRTFSTFPRKLVVKPRIFAHVLNRQSTRVIPHIFDRLYQIVVNFWQLARHEAEANFHADPTSPISTTFNLREVSLTRWRLLSDQVLGLHSQMVSLLAKNGTSATRVMSQMHGIPLLPATNEEITTMDRVLSNAFQWFLVSANIGANVSLSEDISQLTRNWLFCALYSPHSPVVASAWSSLHALLASSRPQVVHFIIHHLLHLLRESPPHLELQRSHKEIQALVDYVGFLVFVSGKNPWLQRGVVSLLVLLLRHAGVSKAAHDVTKSLVTYTSHSTSSPRFQCLEVATVEQIATSRALKNLCDISSPNVAQMCIAQRLTWYQESLSELLLATENFELANSREVAGYMFRFLCVSCRHYLLPDHLRACFHVITAQRVPLNKRALSILSDLLRALRPRANKVLCTDIHLSSSPSNGKLARLSQPCLDDLILPPLESEASFNILKDEEAYVHFVHLNMMSTVEGYLYREPGGCCKSPLPSNAFLPEQENVTRQAKGLHPDLWLQLREEFSKEPLWQQLEQLMKSEALVDVPNLCGRLLACYGGHFLPRIVKLLGFLEREMEHLFQGDDGLDEPLYGMVGIMIAQIVKAMALWPLEERMNGVKTLCDYLISVPRLASILWYMLHMEDGDQGCVALTEFRPLYLTFLKLTAHQENGIQVLTNGPLNSPLEDGDVENEEKVADEDEDEDDAPLANKSSRKIGIIRHFLYISCLCQWRDMSELGNVMRMLEYHLYYNEDASHLPHDTPSISNGYTLEQCNEIFNDYRDVLQQLETATRVGTISAQCDTLHILQRSYMEVDEWIETALLPALGYHVYVLLTSKGQPVSSAVQHWASKWPQYMQQRLQLPEVMETSVGDSVESGATFTLPATQHAQTAVRRVLMLLQTCGSYRLAFWQSLSLLADLLPNLVLLPVLGETVQTFVNQFCVGIFHTTPGTAVIFNQVWNCVFGLREHPSWSCRRLFLQSVESMAFAYSLCYHSDKCRTDMLTAVLQCLRDPHEMVRNSAKSTLCALFRTGFMEANLAENDTLRRFISAQDSEKNTADAIHQWAPVAVFAAMAAAFPNETRGCTPGALLRLAQATQSRHRSVAKMAAEDLCAFKRSSLSVWGKLAEIMEPEDFSFVNECAVWRDNYYV